ncbi:unnamed protein product [Lampetra planeri]
MGNFLGKCRNSANACSKGGSASRRLERAASPGLGEQRAHDWVPPDARAGSVQACARGAWCCGLQGGAGGRLERLWTMRLKRRRMEGARARLQ